MIEKRILLDRIEQLCLEKRISFYTLAMRSGVPITTIMNIMKGKTKNPGIYTIIRLCDGLDISVQDFFGTEDFKKRESSRLQ